MEEDIKLEFVELDDQGCIVYENGLHKTTDNIDNIENAGIVLPNGYMALELSEHNYNKYYYTEPKEEQEGAKYKDLDIFNRIINNYEDICWTGIANGGRIIFKVPENITLKSGTYTTVGGFKALFYVDCELPIGIRHSGSNNEVKYRELEDNFTEEFKKIIIKTPELPAYCYPLLKYNEDISFITNKAYVNAARKQLSGFLKYILFEYPDSFGVKIDYYDKYNKTKKILVNGVAYKALRFINKVFLYEVLGEKDYGYLLKDSCSKNGTSFELVSFSEVVEEQIDYLWYPYIPLGSIVLLAGDPGIGKSYLALKIASIITNGSKFPFDQGKSVSLNKSDIILLNGEDGKGTTIKSRLSKLGADTSKVWFLNESSQQFKIDEIDTIERVLYEKRPKLVIIDPITQYLPAKVSMDRANEVRNILSPIADLAGRYKCTFLIIAHKNKNIKTDGLYRVLGSVDFVGICRSMLTASKVEGITYLKQEKNSISEFGKPIEYSISEDGLEFIKQADLNSSEVENDQPIEEAKHFLLEQLKNGEVAAQDIRGLAYSEGISKSTLDRAKKKLGIKSVQKITDNGEKYWVWSYNTQSKSDLEDEVTNKGRMLI